MFLLNKIEMVNHLMYSLLVVWKVVFLGFISYYIKRWNSRHYNQPLRNTVILLLIMFMASSCQEKDTKENLHFFVAGHAYGMPGITNYPFHPPFMEYLEIAKSDTTLSFGVLTGDIVQECDTTSWNTVDDYLSAFSFDFHFAAGNHDLKNRVLFEKRYGNPNYYFEKGRNLFYFVDLLESGWNFTKAQTQEIKQLTEDKMYDNVFVFTHHVCWYDMNKTPQIKPNSSYGRDTNQTFYNQVLPKLSKIETPIYFFAGDVGANHIGSEITLHKYKNVHLIASGMGGGKWDNIIQVFVNDGVTHIEVDYLSEKVNISIDSVYNDIYM